MRPRRGLGLETRLRRYFFSKKVSARLVEACQDQARPIKNQLFFKFWAHPGLFLVFYCHCKFHNRDWTFPHLFLAHVDLVSSFFIEFFPCFLELTRCFILMVGSMLQLDRMDITGIGKETTSSTFIWLNASRSQPTNCTRRFKAKVKSGFVQVK